MNTEIVGEAVQQDRLLDRQRRAVRCFEAREKAVRIDALTVEHVRLQDRLAEEQRAVVVGTPGDTKDGADSRRDRKDGLAESPASAIDVAFAGPANVAPEVEKIVLLLVAGRIELR